MRPLMLLPVALLGCQADPADAPFALASTARDPHPEPPAIFRDVAMIDDDLSWTHPFVPGHRTTMDGRVAIRVQGGPPGGRRLAENLSFFLFVPEKLDGPVMNATTGPEILASTEPFDVVFPPALDETVTRLGHHAICDPTTELPTEGERPNPYACGPDGRHDCYDLTIVSSTAPTLGATLWGTPVTVEVSDPKTAEAQIADITMGEPVEGITIPLSTEWTEPAVTVDGRLLTGRWGRGPRFWTHPETGESFLRTYDLAYSLLDEGAAPCDVTAWTQFHPMSHAPYDPRMKARYGLAAYPFRDSEGHPIPDGEDLGGTYPWVDREGANVFMAGVHGRVIEQSTTKYPRRCVTPGCEAHGENTDWDRGFLVGGLWTHGKFVHVDGLINNQDWAVGVSPAAHYLVDLYQDAAGAPVPVRFGSGRFAPGLRNAGGPYPPGYTHNANVLDSLQNVANHHRAALPVTPRDVVWILSTGVATDEIAFDDFVDPNALIVSNMQASITQNLDPNGHTTGIPIHHNGQVRAFDGLSPILSEYPLDPEAEADIHVQNGATSLDWAVPAYGHVVAGTGRIEPVALGGIQGRGFWLSGDNAIVYPMPDQRRDLDAQDLYVGIYVDPRAPADEARTLLTFPDGSSIVLSGHQTVRYLQDGVVFHEVALPPGGDGWVHLAWALTDGRTTLTMLHEGLALDRLTTATPRFALEGGDLVVGRADGPWSGVRGWIDDLVVLAHLPDVEVACNHARGTLVEVLDHEDWAAVGARHPRWAHEAVAEAAGADPAATFACVLDHTDDHAAHLGNLPEGTRSLRAAIHFPEGPLRYGAPRPDSTKNAFCLSCHTPESRGGLSLDALAYDPTRNAEDDPRRQPSQPPRRVFGNVPAGWIAPGPGPGGPLEATVAPPEGLLVDRWVLPPAGALGPWADDGRTWVHRH